MNILNIAFYSAKRILQNRKALISKLATIIIIILILGSAFSDAFEPATLGVTKVLYLSDDKGENGQKLFDKMLEVGEDIEIVTFEEVESFAEGEKMVQDDEAAALIYIDEDFTQKIKDSDAANAIGVYTGKYTGIELTIVQNVIDSFINGINTAQAVYQMKGSLEGYSYNMDDALKSMPLSSNGSRPSAMGYYAVTMFVLILLYGMSYGVDGVSEDYLATLGDRMRSLPIRAFDQYFGKILGLSVASFLEGVFVILFTKLVFQVNWGSNYLLLLLITFTCAVSAITIGSMVTMMAKDSIKANSIVNLCIPLLTFIAGGYVKIDIGSLKYVSPSYYAQTAIFNTVYNGSMDMVYSCIVVLWIITFISISVAIFSSRRIKR